METRYTLILGTKDWSSWSLRAYMAMSAVGVPFAEEVIALRRDTTSVAVARRSAAGRVPVLEIAENGETYTVWDSLAICETLAERHPAARLWPGDAQARAEARSLSAEMHAGFADLRAQLSMDFARRLPMPKLREATEIQVARIVSAWSDALTRHGQDGGFLFGNFSVADCMYAPVCSRFRTYSIALPRICAQYVEHMFATPGMIEWGNAARAEVAAGAA